MSNNLKSQIENRAWELSLERGETDGYSIEDWLEAEDEILCKPRAAKKASRKSHSYHKREFTE